jgi:hypothetical protein
MSQLEEWPSNGIDHNRWYTGLGRFIRVLQAFYWGNDSKFKYVRVDPMEIAKHVDMTKVDDAIDRFQQAGVHLFRTAKSLGWPDDGEGALEFMIRRSREVAFEDCGRKIT